MPRKKMPADSGLTPREILGRSPEDLVKEQLIALRSNAQRRVDHAADYARHQPHQAMLWALGTGYLLRLLPTTRIVGGVLRLALVLVKPVALIFGVAKLWHLLQGGVPRSDTRKHLPPTTNL